MSNTDIIIAWGDEEFLYSLSDHKRSHLLVKSAEIIPLKDREAESITGGGCDDQSISDFNDDDGLDVVVL